MTTLSLDDKITLLAVARATLATGWCKDMFADGAGNYCARGAVFNAIGCVTGDSVVAAPDDTLTEQELGKELAADLPVGFVAPYADACPCSRVAMYNNATDQARVLALFDRSIARLRAQRTMSELSKDGWVDFPAAELVDA